MIIAQDIDFTRDCFHASRIGDYGQVKRIPCGINRQARTRVIHAISGLTPLLALCSCVINFKAPATIDADEISQTVESTFQVSEPEELVGLLAGYWIGNYHIDPQTPINVEVARFSSGEYEAHYMISHPDGSESLVMEKGEWGVSGTVYSTFIKEAMNSGMEKPDTIRMIDSYKITFFDGNQLEFCHVHSDRCISMQRAENVTTSSSVDSYELQEESELHI